MTKVVGVRFRNVGKIYYFDPKEYEIKLGTHVIVETARGIEYGKVVMAPREVHDESVVHPLKEVIRVANEEDDERERTNREREREAFRTCQKKIREHDLDMKLIDAEYTFDNNKVLFYFTADGRIDFRLLVKDLASIFKTRIELRQIGVRDETKILGGIGICGRGLCCHTYLSEFAPVSIKMAKEQNLSLNQTKISGVCGRLMCCLKNEQETYEELNRKLPNVGDTVTTPDGHSGLVHSVNVLRQRVKVIVEENDEKEIQEYAVDDLSFHVRKKRTKLTEQEKKELADLEDPIEEKFEKPEKKERPERKEKQPEKKNEKKERSEKKDKPKKEKQDRSEKQERPEKPERSEKPDKTDKNDRSEKQDKQERPERRERSGKNNRSQKKPRPKKPENADKKNGAVNQDEGK